MSDPYDSTSTDDGVPLSSTFLDVCVKVRNNDLSILPEPGKPFKIRRLSEKEDIELANALLENTSVTSLEFETAITKSSAEAMAKYVRTSKRLQRIRWDGESPHEEEILCCFLTAIQESTSLKELDIDLPLIGVPSNMALENMLTHTQSLQSLSLVRPAGALEDAVAAAASGLEKNTTLRELTLAFPRGATTVSPLLTSLRDHPLLRRLCLDGDVRDLTGLETVLRSENSNKITELEINRLRGGRPILGLTHVLQALAHRPTLTKLGLRCYKLDPDEARLLRLVLSSTQSLHSLVLINGTLGCFELAELAPALYHNTSIKELDMSGNWLSGLVSVKIFRDILRSNKTMTALDLSGNRFLGTVGTAAAVECMADGLGSNSTLLKINLSGCSLFDGAVSILAQTLGSRNTALQKLALGNSLITSTGIGVLLETMQHNGNHITDLDLRHNSIGNEGANLLARSLGNNALPNLTHLSISECGIGDHGIIALVSALAQNSSLLHLDLRDNGVWSQGAFLALAESLPEIKVLQQIDLSWSRVLASTMPLLLAGLRKNTSLFRIHFVDCAPSSVPPTPDETARCAGGWMHEMERLGHRNRVLPLILAAEETHRPRGVWPRALAQVATFPDAIFEVLRSKPSLVPSDDTEG
jgi:Ran GTPase-activating protein (RanGAP) involved in mRNA processing and transport